MLNTTEEINKLRMNGLCDKRFRAFPDFYGNQDVHGRHLVVTTEQQHTFNHIHNDDARSNIYAGGSVSIFPRDRVYVSV